MEVQQLQCQLHVQHQQQCVCTGPHLERVACCLKRKQQSMIHQRKHYSAGASLCTEQGNASSKHALCRQVRLYYLNGGFVGISVA